MKVHYLQVGGGSQIGRPAKGGGRDFVGVLGNFNFWVKNIARVVRGVLKFIYINTTFREGSEFTGWGTAYYGNPYNSRESPYLRLIFTQHTIWPLRNPKISTVQFLSPPP